MQRFSDTDINQVSTPFYYEDPPTTFLRASSSSELSWKRLFQNSDSQDPESETDTSSPSSPFDSPSDEMINTPVLSPHGSSYPASAGLSKHVSFQPTPEKRRQDQDNDVHLQVSAPSERATAHNFSRSSSSSRHVSFEPNSKPTSSRRWLDQENENHPQHVNSSLPSEERIFKHYLSPHKSNNSTSTNSSRHVSFQSNIKKDSINGWLDQENENHPQQRNSSSLSEETKHSLLPQNTNYPRDSVSSKHGSFPSKSKQHSSHVKNNRSNSHDHQKEATSKPVGLNIEGISAFPADDIDFSQTSHNRKAANSKFEQGIYIMTKPGTYIIKKPHKESSIHLLHVNPGGCVKLTDLL